MRENSIRVVIIEDHRSLLDCLYTEINLSRGLECVGAFDSFERAFRQFKKANADVVLLDIGLPGLDGIRGCEVLKKKFPRVKVLIFSGFESDEKILAAFAAGADGFLLKRTPRQELAAAIESVHAGGWPMSERVRECMAVYLRWRQSLVPKLSPLERQILERVESGKAQKEIAAEFEISLHTVKTHIKRILEKYGAASAVEAVSMRKRSAF